MGDESQQQHKTGSLFVESDSRKEPRAIDNKAPPNRLVRGREKIPPTFHYVEDQWFFNDPPLCLSSLCLSLFFDPVL